MDKTIEILLYIDELYKDGENTESISLLKTENPEKYEMWRKAFEDYTEEDVKSAVRRYWTYKNDKTAPKVAHLLAYLEEDHKEDKVKTIVAETTAQAAKGDFSWERMNSDIEAGNCRNNLYVYRDAERIVLNEWMAEYMPVDVIHSMGYASKMQKANELNLFADFDEALRQAAQKRFNRDYEFESANDIANAKSSSAPQGTTDNMKDVADYLASHWRA